MTRNRPQAPTQPRATTSVVVCAIAAAALIAADLGTKAWALGALSAPPAVDPGPACVADSEGRTSFQRVRSMPTVLIEDYLEFRYAENCGAAFGLLRDAAPLLRTLLFSVAALSASIALMWMFIRGRGGAAFAVAVPMIVSGALGNLFDRFRFGYVVDFIRFHIVDKFEWPTFNVADIAITVGVGLLLLEGIFEPKTRRSDEPSTTSTPTATS